MQSGGQTNNKAREAAYAERERESMVELSDVEIKQRKVMTRAMGGACQGSSSACAACDQEG